MSVRGVYVQHSGGRAESWVRWVISVKGFAKVEILLHPVFCGMFCGLQVACRQGAIKKWGRGEDRAAGSWAGDPDRVCLRVTAMVV